MLVVGVGTGLQTVVIRQDCCCPNSIAGDVMLHFHTWAESIENPIDAILRRSG